MKPIVLFILIFHTLLLCQPADARKLLDGIAATVNNEHILISDLRRRLKATKTAKTEFRKTLDNMIHEKLIAKEMSTRGIETSGAELEQAVAQIMKQNGIPSKAALTKSLETDGLTYSEFRSNLKEQIRRSKFINTVLAGEITPSERDIEDYYRKTFKDSGGGEFVYGISMIKLLSGKTSSKTLRTKIDQALKSGKTFESLAKKYSKGPSADSGGFLGNFRASEIREDFAKAVVHLEKSQTSKWVFSDDGVYIFRVQTKERAKPKDLPEVRDDIFKILQRNRVDTALARWFQEQRSKGLIKIRIQSSEAL